MVHLYQTTDTESPSPPKITSMFSRRAIPSSPSVPNLTLEGAGASTDTTTVTIAVVAGNTGSRGGRGHNNYHSALESGEEISDIGAATINTTTACGGASARSSGYEGDGDPATTTSGDRLSSAQKVCLLLAITVILLLDPLYEHRHTACVTPTDSSPN